MEQIKIHTDFIKLDQLLKYIGVAATGGEAKWMIEEGMVFVNGEQVFQRGKKCVSGDIVLVDADPKYEGKIL